MPDRDPRELDTRAAQDLPRQVAAFGQPAPLFVITGGDPFQRPDLTDLIGYGREVGVRVAVSPSGTPTLTEERLRAVHAAGAAGLSLSLDGSTAELHDALGHPRQRRRRHGHGIDFHAGSLAPDRPMRTIQPGERLVYRFRAEKAGAWLYHCSTTPMLQHIGNGMYGAVVIDPPGLAKVDHEYVLVSSELYLGTPGSSAQVTKMRQNTPDAWVFNGIAAQYAQRPLKVKSGERARFWVVAAGPSDGIDDPSFEEETIPARQTQGTWPRGSGRRPGHRSCDARRAPGGCGCPGHRAGPGARSACG